MTPDDTFLADIIANPDDDSLRLIYADYLDERGDPRGEFIRVQIELARLSEDDSRRPGLKTSERRLQEKHERKWASPLSGLVQDWWFHRGFVEVIAIPAKTFLRQAEAVFRSAPVRQVLLRHAAGKMARLAACPYLGRLIALDLGGSPIGDDGLRDLLSSPHLGGLRTLDLTGPRAGDDGALAFASGEGLPGLRELRLGDNGIGVRGVQALTQTRLWARLARLDLHDNPLADAGADALLAAPPAWLAFLDLRGCGINEPLRQALRDHFGPSVCRFN